MAIDPESYVSLIDGSKEKVRKLKVGDAILGYDREKGIVENKILDIIKVGIQDD
jgi:hypothetical protein